MVPLDPSSTILSLSLSFTSYIINYLSNPFLSTHTLSVHLWIYNVFLDNNPRNRPQDMGTNRASRPLSRTQAMRRPVSSWAG
jgi:hypothetical protein